LYDFSLNGSFSPIRCKLGKDIGNITCVSLISEEGGGTCGDNRGIDCDGDGDGGGGGGVGGTPPMRTTHCSELRILTQSTSKSPVSDSNLSYVLVCDRTCRTFVATALP